MLLAEARQTTPIGSHTGEATGSKLYEAVKERDGQAQDRTGQAGVKAGRASYQKELEASGQSVFMSVGGPILPHDSLCPTALGSEEPQSGVINGSPLRAGSQGRPPCVQAGCCSRLCPLHAEKCTPLITAHPDLF